MMIIIYFFYGLFFGGLGLAALLQLRSGGDFPLRKHLPWLAAFGFAYAAVGWIEMFQISGVPESLENLLKNLRVILQPLSGLLLLIFGWRILTQLTRLPSWALFIPGVLIVPVAFVIAFAATTFITPSPIEIPIDIWSRYLLYLPGSIMAGIGFLRQWNVHRKVGYKDISNPMLGAGLAFLFEAFIVGLVVPAAPYGPASYYNYDRVLYNAFTGEQVSTLGSYGLTGWLDYEHILRVTGLPIQFWRLISAFIITSFVIRGLDVFDAIRKRQLSALQDERDRAQRATLQAQIVARQEAEMWTEAFVNISRQITELENVDNILIYIVEKARRLLKSDYMAIAILNEKRSYLELKYCSSDGKAEIVDPGVIVRNPLILDTVLNARPYYSKVNEPPEILADLPMCGDNPVAKNIAIVPLTFDSNPVGGLWIIRFDEISYSEIDLIWLECIADQVVIAIKHGLMTSQLQSLSVVEERARIAREMHDGLAQILGYLNLQVQTLEVLLKKEKLQGLESELKQMREAIQLAHADVRENILSLRTTLAHEIGLIPAMIEYIEEFGIQTGIQIQFINEGGGSLELSSIAEVQLVCILQESLANVRKHAKAGNVIVHLIREVNGLDANILLKVTDDGVGFDLRESKRSFGVETMRERAHGVGGILDVYSKPGEGTRVECRLPYFTQERVQMPSAVFS